MLTPPLQVTAKPEKKTKKRKLKTKVIEDKRILVKRDLKRARKQQIFAEIVVEVPKKL